MPDGPGKYVMLASYITLGSESDSQKKQNFVWISDIKYSSSFESVNSWIKEFLKILDNKK